jgi:two-component system, chemotaxis family, response regulator Rcp1
MASSSSDMHSSAVLLYVEDNIATAKMFRTILREMAPEVTLYTFPEGSHAMRFLRQQPPYAHAPRPDLVILDINLPGDSGMDVLTKIRGDAQTLSLPALFFTTSDPACYQENANRLGALATIRKPLGLAELEKSIRFMLDQIPRARAAH